MNSPYISKKTQSFSNSSLLLAKPKGSQILKNSQCNTDFITPPKVLTKHETIYRIRNIEKNKYITQTGCNDPLTLTDDPNGRVFWYLIPATHGSDENSSYYTIKPTLYLGCMILKESSGMVYNNSNCAPHNAFRIGLGPNNPTNIIEKFETNGRYIYAKQEEDFVYYRKDSSSSDLFKWVFEQVNPENIEHNVVLGLERTNISEIIEYKVCYEIMSNINITALTNYYNIIRSFQKIGFGCVINPLEWLNRIKTLIVYITDIITEVPAYNKGIYRPKFFSYVRELVQLVNFNVYCADFKNLRISYENNNLVPERALNLSGPQYELTNDGYNSSNWVLFRLPFTEEMYMVLNAVHFGYYITAPLIHQGTHIAYVKPRIISLPSQTRASPSPIPAVLVRVGDNYHFRSINFNQDSNSDIFTNQRLVLDGYKWMWKNKATDLTEAVVSNNDIHLSNEPFNIAFNPSTSFKRYESLRFNEPHLVVDVKYGIIRSFLSMGQHRPLFINGTDLLGSLTACMNAFSLSNCRKFTSNNTFLNFFFQNEEKWTSHTICYTNNICSLHITPMTSSGSQFATRLTIPPTISCPPDRENKTLDVRFPTPNNGVNISINKASAKIATSSYYIGFAYDGSSYFLNDTATYGYDLLSKSDLNVNINNWGYADIPNWTFDTAYYRDVGSEKDASFLLINIRDIFCTRELMSELCVNYSPFYNCVNEPEIPKGPYDGIQISIYNIYKKGYITTLNNNNRCSITNEEQVYEIKTSLYEDDTYYYTIMNKNNKLFLVVGSDNYIYANESPSYGTWNVDFYSDKRYFLSYINKKCISSSSKNDELVLASKTSKDSKQLYNFISL